MKMVRLVRLDGASYRPKKEGKAAIAVKKKKNMRLLGHRRMSTIWDWNGCTGGGETTAGTVRWWRHENESKKLCDMLRNGKQI